MTGFCKQFDFKAIDDIIALSALYRPGPMDLIPDYIKRKKCLAKKLTCTESWLEMRHRKANSVNGFCAYANSWKSRSLPRRRPFRR
jgi:hypothetical protein